MQIYFYADISMQISLCRYLYADISMQIIVFSFLSLNNNDAWKDHKKVYEAHLFHYNLVAPVHCLFRTERRSKKLAVYEVTKT